MSSNGQPPLTRRQVRELERAREAGEAVTGSISVISGSPVPSAMPVTSPSPAPASSAAAAGSPPAPASVQAPGSAHTPTRRELRALREASAPAPADPVPLRAPKPEHERDLSEALSHVADIENGRATTPVPPREAPRTSAPSPASAAANDDADDADDVESPETGLPAPRSAGREAAGVEEPPVDSLSHGALEPSDEAEQAPGPRRHGAAPRLDEADAGVAERIASSTPPPSSTPTVFPFSLGSAPTPEAESGAAGGPAEVRAADPAPAAAAPAAAADAAAAAPAARADAAPAAPAAAPAAPRQTQIPASVPEPSGYVPPTGHWSTQADLDDDTVESVGAHFGSITSTGQHNALIIGNDQLPDVTGALNATGEIIITGSIDLPRSLAATGSHHAQRIDGSDIDRMLEEGDREQPDSDATPVRASRAVSANTSTRAVVLAAGKPKTNRLPIIATVFGGAVILVIVGLVIAGFATHVL